jgi:hypothetical protein
MKIDALQAGMTVVTATLIALLPVVTFAQPARNANIWNWRAHEPIPSEVQRKERAVGIAPTIPQQRATDRELEDLYRSLIKAPHSRGQGRANNRAR